MSRFWVLHLFLTGYMIRHERRKLQTNQALAATCNRFIRITIFTTNVLSTTAAEFENAGRRSDWEK